jgi:acyl carrier protein
MNLDEFVTKFAEEFTETSPESFKPETEFKKLDEWDSLAVLSIISMIDEKYGKFITGAELRSLSTIKDVYDLVMSK